MKSWLHLLVPNKFKTSLRGLIIFSENAILVGKNLKHYIYNESYTKGSLKWEYTLQVAHPSPFLEGGRKPSTLTKPTQTPREHRKTCVDRNRSSGSKLAPGSWRKNNNLLKFHLCLRQRTRAKQTDHWITVVLLRNKCRACLR